MARLGCDTGALFISAIANLNTARMLERAAYKRLRAPDRDCLKMILDARYGRWRDGSAMVSRGIDRSGKRRWESRAGFVG